MAVNERFDIRSITAAGTLDFIAGRPSFYDNGFSLQIKADGNFELNLLATNLDSATAGNFVDVTSLISGGATITAGGWFQAPNNKMFGTVRVNVTSVQDTKHVNLAGSFAA